MDALQSRFRLVRHRANSQGANMNLTWEGYTWIMLRACNCTPTQVTQILQPLQQRMPNTEAEFDQMLTTMRRMAHIMEHNAGNLGSHIARGGYRSNYFGTDGDGDGQTAVAFMANGTDQSPYPSAAAAYMR